MKNLSFISCTTFLLLCIFSCENPVEEVMTEIDDELGSPLLSKKASSVTGFVEVEWKGKGGRGTTSDKNVFARFSAREATMISSNDKYMPARGSFEFSVVKDDGTLERRILAQVETVGFSAPEDGKAWFLAEVISDSKCESQDHSGCGDSSHDDGGCTHDDTSQDGGGCTHDDTTHDGGSAHDDTGTVHGGCSHDDTSQDDGGGTHDDTTHDGGCAHDDTGTVDGSTHDPGGSGGCEHDDTGTDTGCDHGDTGSDDHTGSDGKPVDKGGKGKLCRVGQYLIAKMHDKGSPGTLDGITWKWFDTVSDFNIEEEPKRLCKKTILEGNLVVHFPKSDMVDQ